MATAVYGCFSPPSRACFCCTALAAGLEREPKRGFLRAHVLCGDFKCHGLTRTDEFFCVLKTKPAQAVSVFHGNQQNTLYVLRVWMDVIRVMQHAYFL